MPAPIAAIISTTRWTASDLPVLQRGSHCRVGQSCLYTCSSLTSRLKLETRRVCGARRRSGDLDGFEADLHCGTNIFGTGSRITGIIGGRGGSQAGLWSLGFMTRMLFGDTVPSLHALSPGGSIFDP